MRSILLVGVICISVPVMALGRAAPIASNDPLLVIVPPWLDAQAIVQDAGGDVIGLDHALFGVLAHGPDEGFAQAVLHAGAWAVRDGTLLAALC